MARSVKTKTGVSNAQLTFAFSQSLSFFVSNNESANTSDSKVRHTSKSWAANAMLPWSKCWAVSWRAPAACRPLGWSFSRRRCFHWWRPAVGRTSHARVPAPSSVATAQAWQCSRTQPWPANRYSLHIGLLSRAFFKSVARVWKSAFSELVRRKTIERRFSFYFISQWHLAVERKHSRGAVSIIRGAWFVRRICQMRRK